MARGHLSSRKKLALVSLSLIIFTSIEVYAHCYVQIQGLPVVTMGEVDRFSSWLQYTGTSTFSGSGCVWFVGWIVRRPAPQYGYVNIFKITENKRYFILGTDFLVISFDATSNHSSGFWAYMDEIEHENNYTALRIDYEFGEIGTYQINIILRIRVYERMLLGLIPKEDITIPISATIYYGP